MAITTTVAVIAPICPRTPGTGGPYRLMNQILSGLWLHLLRSPSCSFQRSTGSKALLPVACLASVTSQGPTSWSQVLALKFQSTLVDLMEGTLGHHRFFRAAYFATELPKPKARVNLVAQMECHALYNLPPQWDLLLFSSLLSAAICAVC